MFVWDFVADTVLGQIIGFLGDFFMQMGNMGADLFAMIWVQSVVLFFSYLAWALYDVGLVVGTEGENKGSIDGLTPLQCCLLVYKHSENI